MALVEILNVWKSGPFIHVSGWVKGWFRTSFKHFIYNMQDGQWLYSSNMRPVRKRSLLKKLAEVKVYLRKKYVSYWYET